MEKERKQRLELKSEMSKQTRITQLEEKERCMSALEFKYIGYQGNSMSKNRWLELEAEKKKVLSSQAKQEREALFRAKELVLKKIEEEEILRRKRESYNLTKCAPLARNSGSRQRALHVESPTTTQSLALIESRQHEAHDESFAAENPIDPPSAAAGNGQQSSLEINEDPF